MPGGKNCPTLQFPIGLTAEIWLIIRLDGIRPWFTRLQEVCRMSKSRDTKKDKKKQPQMTLKEKREAKRAKKNA
jgi:hypothetical protein